MTFREELKTGTAESHQKLDSNSRIMRDDFALEDYKNLLRNWAEFYLAFEMTLHEKASTFVEANNFMKGREKSPLLEADLQAFGLSTSRDAIDRLKTSPLFTRIFLDAPSLWAALYVLEGSTLGGQVLSKRLISHFADSTASFEFYQGYGEQTGVFWRRFVTKLETLGFNDEQTKRGVETAQQLFSFFAEYLER